MPINKIVSPSEVPASVDDYSAQNNLTEALLLAVQGAQRIVGSNVAKGAVFLVGGATYLADADTAISGSASDYVKLTPSVDGLTIAPSYVASLSGVSWNSTYNGYYDASGNLYVFDELKALGAGALTTLSGRYAGLAGIISTERLALVGKYSLGNRTRTTDTFASIETVIVPQGEYYVRIHENYSTLPWGAFIEVKESGGNWVVIQSVNVAGEYAGTYVKSDGTNVRVRGGTGGSGSVPSYSFIKIDA